MELFSFPLVLVIKTKILEEAQATTQTTTTSKATEEAIDLDSFGKTKAVQFFLHFFAVTTRLRCDNDFLFLFFDTVFLEFKRSFRSRRCPCFLSSAPY